jgi:hypothetical protein
MMHIQQLPIEILTSILEFAREEDGQSMNNCRLVSRHFQRIAKRLFFEHICYGTSDRNVLSLVKSLQETSINECIRSFSICSLSCGDRECYEGLELLSRQVRSLPRLTTQSIHQDLVFDLSSTSVWIKKHIGGLPPWLTSLEFETDGPELICISNASGSWHVCDAIGDLVPQLHVLRIRGMRLCTRLMHKLEKDSAATSQLRQVVLRLSGQTSNRHFCHKDLTGRDYSDATPSSFSRHLLETRYRGAFPYIEHFLVINYRFTASFREGIHSYDRIRDIATESSITVPSWVVGANRNNEERQYIFRGFDGKDLIGRQQDLSNFVEGSLCWRTLSNGSRLPPLRGKSNDRLDLGTAPSLDREAAGLPVGVHELMSELWTRERRVGAPVMRATLSEGIDDESDPLEMLPPGWEYFLEGSTMSVRRIV